MTTRTATPVSDAFDAVVLAGGAARRLGGVDKPALRVGDRTLLDTALAAVRDARATVVVGPQRPVVAPVTWAREEPAGGGPVAALGAGLAALPTPAAGVVVVLAADLPHVEPSTVSALLRALEGGADAACLVDAGGRRQPLTAAYRRDPLAGALARASPLHGRAVHRVLADLGTVEVSAGRAAQDVDTPDDLAAAIRLARDRRKRRDVMEEYVTRLCQVLGVERGQIDVNAVLDLARDAAHHVERPAAPVTTYLAGLAAGLGGGDSERRATAIRDASDLAVGWDGNAASPGGAAP